MKQLYQTSTLLKFCCFCMKKYKILSIPLKKNVLSKYELWGFFNRFCVTAKIMTQNMKTINIHKIR